MYHTKKKGPKTRKTAETRTGNAAANQVVVVSNTGSGSLNGNLRVCWEEETDKSPSHRTDK